MFALKATCTLLISMQVQNPIYQLSGFLGYYRFPAVIPRMEMTIILLFTVLPYLLARLPPDAQACISIYGLTEHGISSNKLSLYSFKLQF
ncbi:hypothetical protein NXY06_18505 [Bacteroides uniformis]|uniref:hypothetical protein n=1 Tax=Bacteroides uniformis TaxID=820 RepID=UPI0021655419|nr:hypothetical protein [Bacteroides uniformis]MCS3352947.1 hypothetical protein [Bacteroides uniformis]